MRNTLTGKGSDQKKSVKTRRRRSQTGREAGWWSIEGRQEIVPVLIMLTPIFVMFGGFGGVVSEQSRQSEDRGNLGTFSRDRRVMSNQSE